MPRTDSACRAVIETVRDEAPYLLDGYQQGFEPESEARGG